MESTLDVLDESGNVIKGMENIYRQRLAQLSSSPELQQAARRLVDSNRTMREYASQHGIDIDELSGYMAHILTRDAMEARKHFASSGRKGIGGRHEIRNRRQIEGTVDEINDRLRQEMGIDYDLFEPNAYFATALGQRRTLQYVLADRAKKEVLDNPSFARIVTGERVGQLGRDEALINVNDYRFFKNAKDELVGRTVQDADQYIVTKGAKKLLDSYKEKLSDDGIRTFIDNYKKAHNVWKKFALFSTGYHARNYMGNAFNMWVSGMPINEVFSATFKAGKERSTAVKALEKLRQGQKVTGKEQKIVDRFQEFRQQGLNESSIFANDFVSDPAAHLTRDVTRGAKNR